MCPQRWAAISSLWLIANNFSECIFIQIGWSQWWIQFFHTIGCQSARWVWAGSLESIAESPDTNSTHTRWRQSDGVQCPVINLCLSDENGADTDNTLSHNTDSEILQHLVDLQSRHSLTMLLIWKNWPHETLKTFYKWHTIKVHLRLALMLLTVCNPLFQWSSSFAT